MSNEELTQLILTKLGWAPDKEVKKERKNSKAIIAYDLIYAILEGGKMVVACEYLGISIQTLHRIIAKHLVPVFGTCHGGGETWKFTFLTYIELRYCSNCHLLLPFINFDNNKCDSTGKHHYCKECRKDLNKIIYAKESTQEAHKRSHELHRPEIRERNARYKIERSQRVPKWADLEKIKEFYRGCPEGYHVDHILPLKGELISGLHVLGNLQYLTAEENMKKGNRYLPV